MKDPSGLDLLVALLGTLGALLLLIAAFAAAAQNNDPTTDRLIVRVADCAHVVRLTRPMALADVEAIARKLRSDPAAPTPPAPSADATMATPAAAAMESAGGGGGGCTVAR